MAMKVVSTYGTVEVFPFASLINDRDHYDHVYAMSHRHHQVRRGMIHDVHRYAWHGKSKTFNISVVRPYIVFNRALERHVIVKDWKLEVIIKWIPSAKRLDFILPYGKGKRMQFRMMSPQALNESYFTTYIKDECKEAIKAWAYTVSDGAIVDHDHWTTWLVNATCPVVRMVPTIQDDVLDSNRIPLWLRLNDFEKAFRAFIKKSGRSLSATKDNRKLFSYVLRQTDATTLAGIALKGDTAWALAYSGRLDYNKIRELLEIMGYENSMSVSEYMMDTRILDLSWQRIKRLAEEPRGFWLWTDALRMVETLRDHYGAELDISRCRTGMEAHDMANETLRRYWEVQNRVRNERLAKALQERIIPADPYVDLLKLDLGDIKIIKPDNGAVLQQWGNSMQNCISSYLTDAEENRCLLFALERDGQIIACGEIRNRRLSQLLGKVNSQLPDDVRWPVYNAMVKAHIIVDDKSGWGMQQL